MHSTFQPAAHSMAGLAREIIAQGFCQPGRPFYGSLPADKVNFFLCFFLSFFCVIYQYHVLIDFLEQLRFLWVSNRKDCRLSLKNDVMTRS